MTDQERLDKNAVCDLLMKEGLNGWRDEENVARASLLTDLAIELERKVGLTCALAWSEALEEKGTRGEQAILLDYNRANAIAGERYGTEWRWDQASLARELYYLRRAVSHQKFTRMSDVFRCKCLNNLGNRLNVAGRAIEALECWRRALEVSRVDAVCLMPDADVSPAAHCAIERRPCGPVLAMGIFAMRLALSPHTMKS